ncbi:MAG: AAA family ATPase, partial [Myxococcales bacterium]|nr:AAA family ATPase [Myxococcales bacterium]
STRGTAIPLVGRSGERARMLAAIEGLFRGEHAVVLIDGEPGIGKTRFLDEIARDAEWRGLQPLRGAFEEGESSPPFSAIVAAIGRALNPLRIEQLAGIAPRTALQVLTPLVPALSAHLRELGAAATIDANSRQGRLLDAFAQLLFAWSRLHPLLIILEDLQWADRDSLILLEHALESFATAPRGFHGIGLAVSYRLADARGRSEVWQTIERLDRRRVAQRLTLSAFDESATRELLRRAMHEATLPAAFEERLHAESGGNPLFLIETLRVLQERGVVSRDDDGRWHTPFDAPNASLDELALPREVERVIESRLESLPDELRQTLVAATVLGSEFDFGQLGAVVAQSPERLSDSVRQLRERQFVEESPDALRFSHTKVRQVAYAQLLESERLELHRKAAQTLENQQQTRLEAMAHHYVEGRIWDKAVTFGIKAGEQAEAVHANRAALQHYRRAHEILERQQPFSPDRRLYLAFDLLEGISRLLGLVGETTEQQQALHRLQQCAKALGNPERQARAFNQMATFLCSRLDFYDAAEKAARTAYDFAMKHHLLSQAAEALEIIGTSHEMRDQLDEAEAALRESHALWETLDPFSTATLRLKRELATVFWKMRRLDEAEQLCLETLPLADELDDHQTLTQLYKMLAVFSGKRADFGAVQRYQEIALEHVRRAGVRSDEATILANQALALREVGRLGPALRQMRQALELEQQLALRRGIALSAYNLAYLLLEVGQLDEVEQLTERVGRPQLAAIDSLSAELLYRCNDAIWQNERGAFDEAAAIAQEATNRAVETGMRYHEALLRLNWGLALLRGGSGAEAETQLKQALTIWREIGERVFAITTHSFIAEALRRQGLTERALCEIDVAVSALEKTTALDLPHAGYLIRARILDDLGRSDEARQALEQALGAFEALAETLDDEREREIFRRVPQLSRELFSFSREFSARAFGVRISVRLPCCEAPLGRPLRDDELVEVAWTVSSPDDQVHRSRTARRQAQIRRLLVEARQAGAAPSYNHIADALGVSSRTIERDMLQLRQQFPDLPPTRR